MNGKHIIIIILHLFIFQFAIHSVLKYRERWRVCARSLTGIRIYHHARMIPVSANETEQRVSETEMRWIGCAWHRYAIISLRLHFNYLVCLSLFQTLLWIRTNYHYKHKPCCSSVSVIWSPFLFHSLPHHRRIHLHLSEWLMLFIRWSVDVASVNLRECASLCW